MTRHPSMKVLALAFLVLTGALIGTVLWIVAGTERQSLMAANDADIATVTNGLRAEGIDDRVRGLEAGGDDYLIKPFAFEELLARIRAMTRRQAPAAARLFAGSIEMDLVQRTVLRHGRPIELLPQEFRLLEYLLRHADRTVTRKMLLENVWDIHFDPHTSVVESHVSRLRARLNAPGEPDAIQTVRGTGYRLLASN